MNIPEHTKYSIDNWAKNKIRTGGFLEAVIDGDLYGALNRADSENSKALTEIVSYVNSLSGVPRGYKGAMRDWCNEKSVEWSL